LVLGEYGKLCGRKITGIGYRMTVREGALAIRPAADPFDLIVAQQ
jgi:hypothetical protein